MTDANETTGGKCPVPHGKGARSNRDWWPEHLDIGRLHATHPDADPMGKGFDYAKEFQSLDYAALKKDIKY